MISSPDSAATNCGLHLAWPDIKHCYRRSVLGLFWLTIATGTTGWRWGLRGQLHRDPAERADASVVVEGQLPDLKCSVTRRKTPTITGSDRNANKPSPRTQAAGCPALARTE
ncbi:hypothetical protein MGAST_26100 [Mycobacterium gastri 'Wayne']|uniref:Uncharacterized protein n=1 Tax=Mycobacterium gastri TaxID=1777 RepID=A0A1X1VXW4_MYCGS|nr:hypothetical protein MGAST_26100 [Mycobacterium gastri 'Wayne']ORV74730.1 hypothetical protein AWC07_24250 [Mycobacterium gastri]